MMSYHTLALDKSGNIWGWGSNSVGEAGPGAPTNITTGPVQLPSPTTVPTISSVKFGTLPATTFTVDSATQITATTPAQPYGFVDVILTDIANRSIALTNGFEYLNPHYVILSLDKSGVNISALPDDTVYSDVITATVDTNWTPGIALAISQDTNDTDLKCASDNSSIIPVIPTDNASLNTNSWGVGISGNTTTPPSLWRNVSITPTLLASTSSTGITNHYIHFGARANMNKRPCTYTGTVTVTAVANP